jgi:hypothetical protein
VNTEGDTFSPEQKAQLAAVWNSAQGFGKYKAFLNLDYGDSQRASVQDTVFFWIVPWKQLSIAFVIGALLVVFLVFYYQRRYDVPLAVAHVAEPVPYVPEPVHHAPAAPKKKSWFARRERATPLPEVVHEPVHEPAPVLPPPAPVVTPPQPQLRSEAHVQPQHGTINLKELCKRPDDCPPPTHEVHVINLKR